MERHTGPIHSVGIGWWQGGRFASVFVFLLGLLRLPTKPIVDAAAASRHDVGVGECRLGFVREILIAHVAIAHVARRWLQFRRDGLGRLRTRANHLLDLGACLILGLVVGNGLHDGVSV
jgi:hypothetical protein